VPANTLQQVCKRVDLAFQRFISGDSSASRSPEVASGACVARRGGKSGKPRFKNKARYRSMVFEGAGLELHSCSVGGKYLYIKIPKLGLLKVRSHRHLPNGAVC
jgi:putative transposase